MIEYRFANEKDADELASLEKENFSSPWTKEQFEYEIKENEFSNTLVIFDGNILIGYITYWILFDQGEINKICIRKEYRNKGLATELMERTFEEFKKKECFVASLEVRKSNISAQKLYEKFGFVTVLTKKQYYSDGEDAYYMVKGTY